MPRCISKDFCRKKMLKRVNSSNEALVSNDADFSRNDETRLQEDIQIIEDFNDINPSQNFEDTDGDENNYEEHMRFLSAHTQEFENMVFNIWNRRRNLYTVVYYCNRCGAKSYREKTCCGPNVKFVRVGVLTQMQDVVAHYYTNILDLRRKLKRGDKVKHNLSAPFFKSRWENEKNDELLLSGLLSIDGICIPGNKKRVPHRIASSISNSFRKLWPVSVMLIDLPTCEMQKSCNILLEGIAECTSNPSTAFWNAVYPSIQTDCESSTRRVNNHVMRLKIVTTNSDQPAKRALFGMKAHQSSLSCFYCLSRGTFYKTSGEARREARPRLLTIEDSRRGQNGFTGVHSQIIQSILPYETPVDILHNLGEGIFAVILNELLSVSANRKSDFFNVNVTEFDKCIGEVVVPSSLSNMKNCRNGTDRINYFRLVVCSIAIQNSIISAKGRLVIIAISLLANKMYGFQESSILFDDILCGAGSWFLKEANEAYLTTKCHEILYHLPQTNRLFGSVAPLSTFSFESSYQYSFMGYSSRMTRNFCETASSRVLLHNSVRREIVRRAESENITKRFRLFLASCKGISSMQSCYEEEIAELYAEDSLFLGENIRMKGYSVLSLSSGRIRSVYFNSKTTDDVFFTEETDIVHCYRFIGFFVGDSNSFVLAEELIDIRVEEQFISIRTAIEGLSGTDLYYGREILKTLIEFGGVRYCRLSGERKRISHRAIKSIACYVNCENAFCVISVNGTPIHN